MAGPAGVPISGGLGVRVGGLRVTAVILTGYAVSVFARYRAQRRPPGEVKREPQPLVRDLCLGRRRRRLPGITRADRPETSCTTGGRPSCTRGSKAVGRVIRLGGLVAGEVDRARRDPRRSSST